MTVHRSALEVNGALTQDGDDVLDVGDITLAQVNRIKENPKITVSATEPSSPSTGDIWIDTGA